MHITVTYIKLRSAWGFFKLSNHGRKIQMQAKKSPGFLSMKNTGWGKMHYTLSAWENEESRKEFAKSGAHLEAMKQSSKLSTELGTFSYVADQLPDWKTAKEMVLEKGKILRF